MSEMQTISHPCTKITVERGHVVIDPLIIDYIAAAGEYFEVRNKVTHSGGQIVREWREAQGVSLRKMAQQLGVTPSFLSKVERGKETLSPELAAKIAGY